MGMRVVGAGTARGGWRRTEGGPRGGGGGGRVGGGGGGTQGPGRAGEAVGVGGAPECEQDLWRGRGPEDEWVRRRGELGGRVDSAGQASGLGGAGGPVGGRDSGRERDSMGA